MTLLAPRSLRWALLPASALLLYSAEGPGDEARSGQITGIVSSTSGGPAAGVFVTARAPGANVAYSVVTDQAGRYTLPQMSDGSYRVEAHGVGYQSSELNATIREGETSLQFALALVTDPFAQYPSSAFLSLLPDGEEKRLFKLDCTGCHQFNRTTAFDGDQPKSRETWIERTQQMLGFAGASTGFPVIDPHREAQATADWLLANLPGFEEGLARYPAITPSPAAGRAVFTEWDIPVPQDLPHDLMVDPDGAVMITGMMTQQMYLLDPSSGAFTNIPIPVQYAGPRALDRAANGDWWVLLGNPRKLARYSTANGQWQDWDIGMYPHSIQIAPDGKVWFNGHFTKDPPILGSLDPATGELETFEVPENGLDPDDGGPIPYGLRVAADGTVWSTELHGNRLIKYVPSTGEFGTYVMPTIRSGPRRPDVAPDGMIWIPEYSGNKLAKFDPRTEEFTEYDFPIDDALPYVVRVDRGRGTVWIGTAAADAMVSFDPAAERFTVHPLPTRVALIRHIDIDHASGTVWAAYGDSPAVNPRILRLEVR
jgi:virginiamycin B lyase